MDIEYFEHIYDQLIQYIKDSNEHCKITICNSYPRSDTSTSEVNDIIQTLAEHHGVCLIDQDKAFYDRHGKIIEGYDDTDCIHLSSSGVKSLLGTINKEVNDFAKCVFIKHRRNRAQPQQSRPTRRRNRPDRPRDNDDNRQESLQLCYKCGESITTTPVVVSIDNN